jgi:hypothetical protein
MAVDTAAKRFSMIGFGRPFLKLLVPSGTVDRRTLIDLYNGIALSDVVVIPELAMSTRNKIQFMADSRTIDFAYNDRRIEMPA